MSDSIWDDPNVTAFILGELSTEEAEAFEERIRENSSLAEVVAEARSVTNQLQIMYTEDASTTLDPKRRDAITEGNQTNTLAATGKLKWRMPLTLLATAAAFLLLLGSPYLFEPAHTVSNESTDPFSPESRDSEGFSGSINAVESLAIDSSRNQPNGAVPATGMSHLNEMKSIELETRDEFGDGLEMDGEMNQDDVAGFGMGATAPRNVAQKKVCE